jgi:hypothetical protein
VRTTSTGPSDRSAIRSAASPNGTVRSDGAFLGLDADLSRRRLLGEDVVPQYDRRQRREEVDQRVGDRLALEDFDGNEYGPVGVLGHRTAPSGLTS